MPTKKKGTSTTEKLKKTLYDGEAQENTPKKVAFDNIISLQRQIKDLCTQYHEATQKFNSYEDSHNDRMKLGGVMVAFFFPEIEDSKTLLSGEDVIQKGLLSKLSSRLKEKSEDFNPLKALFGV